VDGLLKTPWFSQECPDSCTAKGRGGPMAVTFCFGMPLNPCLSALWSRVLGRVIDLFRRAVSARKEVKVYALRT
jgi:hypothetical protein